LDALELLSLIARDHSEISLFRLFEFRSAPSLQQRLVSYSGADQEVVRLALAMKRDSRVSFWQALLTVMSESENCSSSLIAATLFHQPNAGLFEVTAQDVAALLVENEGKNIALNSAVVCADRREHHLPLLDFKVPASRTALAVVRESVRQMGLRGYLLESGRSYHFWGRDLISREELNRMLARFVLLHPISDKSWAAHQLIEGSASLRISKRYGHLPRVIDELE